eukprot:2962069-Rhodomonas_salina.5
MQCPVLTYASGTRIDRRLAPHMPETARAFELWMGVIPASALRIAYALSGNIEDLRADMNQVSHLPTLAVCIARDCYAGSAYLDAMPSTEMAYQLI